MGALSDRGNRHGHVGADTYADITCADNTCADITCASDGTMSVADIIIEKQEPAMFSIERPTICALVVMPSTSSTTTACGPKLQKYG